MESELRKRFVIVTALLVTIVLAVFYTATHLYYSYWFDQDTLVFIDWIADNEIRHMTDSSDEYELDIPQDTGAIIAAVITSGGKVVSQRHIGSSDSDILSSEMLQDITQRDEDEYKSGSYIYTVRELDTGKLLVVCIYD